MVGEKTTFTRSSRKNPIFDEKNLKKFKISWPKNGAPNIMASTVVNATIFLTI